MTDLRARLAEVLALNRSGQMDGDFRDYELASELFLADPALARALEDAERVHALEEALRACRDYYVRMFGLPVDTANVKHHSAAKEMIDKIDAAIDAARTKP